MRETKYILILLLFSISTSFSQYVDEVGGNLGFNFNFFDVNEISDISRGNVNGGGIDLFVGLNVRQYFDFHKPLSVSLGFEYSYGVIDYSPLKQLNEWEEFKSQPDSFIVASVFIRKMSFNVPVIFSYDIMYNSDDDIDTLNSSMGFFGNSFFEFGNFTYNFGIRFNLGIEYRGIFNRTYEDVDRVLDYDQYGYYAYHDEELNQLSKNELSKTFRNYTLHGIIGAEFIISLEQYGFRVGINHFPFLFSPIEEDLINQFGLKFIIGFSYRFD